MLPEQCSSQPASLRLRYRPTLSPHVPRDAMEAAIELGNPWRSQALGRRAASGCPIRTAAVGGSSTAGHKMGRISPILYHARVASWLRNQSLDPSSSEHHHANAGTPAIGP
eukprot:2165167-Prymnesium_polylepis.1